MKKIIKSWGGNALLGLFIITLSLASCGGSDSTGGSDGNGGGGTIGTAAEQAQALNLLKSVLDFGGAIGVFLQLSGVPTEETPVLCALGGTFTLTPVSATSLTITLAECDVGCSIVNGSFVLSFGEGGTTTNDFSASETPVTITPDSGSVMTMGGTSGGTISGQTFNLTGTSSSDAIGVAGDAELDATFALTGVIALTAAGETFATCNLDAFANFDQTGATPPSGIMANLATQCGISTAPTCSP